MTAPHPTPTAVVPTRTIWRLEHPRTGLGPYQSRGAKGGELISNANWRHRPMPSEDPLLTRRLRDDVWMGTYRSAFLRATDVGRWFETDWERAALAREGFVVRAYVLPDTDAAVVAGATQALVHPKALVPAHCHGTWPVTEFLALAPILDESPARLLTPPSAAVRWRRR